MLNFKTTEMKSIVIVPARLGSERLPNKPLFKINGKSIIRHTLEQVIASGLQPIALATDSHLVLDECASLTEVIPVMTSTEHACGTERVLEAYEKISSEMGNYDIIINVQGDEPLLNPRDLRKLINLAKRHPKKVLNGVCKIHNEDQYRSRSIPKVVMRKNMDLLYMSRAAIPATKRGDFIKAWRQVCIYSFPKSSLIQFKKYGKKSTLEKIEDIEILRFLDLGINVRMIPLSNTSVAVDTLEDVEKVNNILQSK